MHIANTKSDNELELKLYRRESFILARALTARHFLQEDVLEIVRQNEIVDSWVQTFKKLIPNRPRMIDGKRVNIQDHPEVFMQWNAEMLEEVSVRITANDLTELVKMLQMAIYKSKVPDDWQIVIGITKKDAIDFYKHFSAIAKPFIIEL